MIIKHTSEAKLWLTFTILFTRVKEEDKFVLKLIHLFAKKSPIISLFLLLLLLEFLSPMTSVFAQTLSTGVAIYVDIPGQNVQPGSVVSLSSHEYKLSNVAYDPTAIGVVIKNPSVSLENPLSISKYSYPIIHEGKAYVLVNTANGKIQTGDILTTSNTPGIAQKATEDGYVIGTALENYDNSNKQKPGLILANITFTLRSQPINTKTQNVFSSFQQIINTGYVSPATIIRYIAAALVVVFSFLLGIGYFGRIATSGIEALGRNPLASKLIWAGIVFNISVMLLLIIIGIAVSYFILVI